MKHEEKDIQIRKLREKYLGREKKNGDRGANPGHDGRDETPKYFDPSPQ